MRVTINLPDDIHSRVAVDALKKRRNSKEAVITEILRAYYGGGTPRERQQAVLRWRISPAVAKRIQDLRHEVKTRWT